MTTTNDYISLYHRTGQTASIDSNHQKTNEYKDLNDKELLKLSKEEIISNKNKTIDNLNEMISYLVLENDKLKEKYAQSVSFFKNYISMLERDLSNVVTKSTETNTNSISTTSQDKIGNFIRCEFCDDILPIDELQSHIDSNTNITQLVQDIKSRNLRGVEEALKHGVKASLTTIDRSTGQCSFIL